MDTLFHSFTFRKLITATESECINLLIKMCEFFCWSTGSFRFKYKEATHSRGVIELELTFSIEVMNKNANSHIASLFTYAASLNLLFLAQQAVTFSEL